MTNISQPGFFTISRIGDELRSPFSSLESLGERYEVDVEFILFGEYEDDGVTEDVFLDSPEEVLRLVVVVGYFMLLDEESAVVKLSSSSSQKSDE